MSTRTTIAMLAGLALVGCARHVVFQEDAKVPDGIWQREWKPQFTFQVDDTIAQRNIFLDIRHTGDYPFSNLYLFATLQQPDGTQLTDTVECILADPAGRWYGKGAGFIFSDRFQAHILYKVNNRFPAKGNYSLTLEQAMRTDELPGVIDVGISVEAQAAR